MITEKQRGIKGKLKSEFLSPKRLEIDTWDLGFQEGAALTYELIRSKERKKTITLQIRADGSVVIRAPARTPKREIDTFFASRTQWIERKLEERHARSVDHDKDREFVPGGLFLYLGEDYPLELASPGGRREALSLSRGRFILDHDRLDGAKDEFVRWYRKMAKEDFVKRVAHWSRLLGLTPGTLRISGARTRYGSCSSRNNLSLSWRLIMAPVALIDYVVVHELVHIDVKNHSKIFWARVGQILPDFKTRRQWLRKHGHLLNL